ncbi:MULTISPECIES: squalene/phytoene synthase family protein [Pacificibacter]|uniref:squalene/phytoene synthase family protein n=1 Tax=Pacificibacter TaxID=1042323 RepID=UPI001C098980|nr:MULTISPECIES: squalene/phytoene synthase family protein [Pacificibacter]MBU2936915.1 squalene/phytoene synthase family protein [Pacificibacter marinus]MDO6614909.1 squalene/phytoene synthase family protein [Pacificibacter sp. 1_MG-2023]
MAQAQDIQACAELVKTADQERFRATMAAPVPARDVLFPIHAFCLEVAKAPWLTKESMIAEMRLQFWRDVLQEKIDGKDPRAHEVARPLAGVLDAEAAQALDATVTARQWDIYKDPHDDIDAFKIYLTNSYALPLVQASRLLGASSEACNILVNMGYAGALVRYFAAVPKLQEMGRVPLIDGRLSAVADLAAEALDAVRGSGGVLAGLSKSARAPLNDAMTHLPLLKVVVKDPSAVIDGRLSMTHLRQSLRLTFVSQVPSWAFV